MESKPKVHKPQDFDQDYSSSDAEDVLLPGLPNHLARLCLSRTHPSHLFSVCHSWRRLIYSPSFPPFFSLYAILSSIPSSQLVPHHRHHHHHEQNSIVLFSLDPFSNSWKPLPPPPLPRHFLHNHPSFLSRKLPIQSLTVSGVLVLVAGTDPSFLPALSSPLVFLPKTCQWSRGPPLPEPRRWCAAGSTGGSVYVASGIGRRYNGDVARSMEKWDLEGKQWKWEKKAMIRDGRFSREAIEAVAYKGKLCMVNVKGNAVKEGAVYDVESDRWEEMPEGMVRGWNGPAAAAAEEEADMYVVDESKAVLSKYNGEEDKWEKVVEAAELKGAEQIAAGRGRVCAVCDNGKRIAVVNVAAEPATVWTVEPPLAVPVVALHILPRMSHC